MLRKRSFFALPPGGDGPWRVAPPLPFPRPWVPKDGPWGCAAVDAAPTQQLRRGERPWFSHHSLPRQGLADPGNDRGRSFVENAHHQRGRPRRADVTAGKIGVPYPPKACLAVHRAQLLLLPSATAVATTAAAAAGAAAAATAAAAAAVATAAAAAAAATAAAAAATAIVWGWSRAPTVQAAAQTRAAAVRQPRSADPGGRWLCRTLADP
eukprot:gene7746-biopygen4582